MIKIDPRRGCYAEIHGNVSYRGNVPWMAAQLAKPMFEYYELSGDADAAIAVTGMAESILAENRTRGVYGDIYGYSHNPHFQKTSNYHILIAAIMGYAHECTGSEEFLRHLRAMYRQTIAEESVNPVGNCYWETPTVLHYLEQHGEGAAPLTDEEAGKYASALKLPGITAGTLADVRALRNVEFAHYADQAMLLDLYLPREATGPFPCIVVIKGGGFRPANKEGFAHLAAYHAANGFAAACISYRRAPDHPFPAAVHDTKAAVRWVRANAAKYNIDPNRIGAIGQSAGGHLSVMLAVTNGVAELEGNGGNPKVSSAVQAAVSWAGVFDFISRLRDGGQQAAESLAKKRQSNAAWIGEPFSETSDLWKKASPISYLTPDDSPVSLVHCKGDKTVPYEQSQQMHRAMREHHLDGELLLLQEGGHGISGIQGINEQAWRATLGFFKTTLKVTPPEKTAPTLHPGPESVPADEDG